MPIQQFSAGQTLTAAQMNALQESDFNYTIKTETGSSYTLIESDLGKMIKFTNSGGVTLTVPTDASADFNVGDTIDVLLDSTGTLTVQGASGVTVSSEGGVDELNTRYSIASLIKLAANSWMLTGVMMNTITDEEVTTAKIADSAVTSAKIADGTIVNADVNASAAIAISKLATSTSSQLASIISDETGSGALVFGTAPTITPAEGTTTNAHNGAGYMGMPQVSLAVGRTLNATDAGKHIYVTAGSQTITIPANTVTAFPVGTTIVVVTDNGVSTSIAINTDTLRLANSSSTGTRTVASNGMATLLKITNTVWICSGNGVT